LKNQPLDSPPFLSSFCCPSYDDVLL
jgi:hypothetical protein